ncbi:MAG: hypothetical protein SOZ23_00970 [Methanosphaera sp.]|uniref:hypothetical protein n=1 Tax=Methanosphaera sp. TaxID=2666342 RepID=UPI0025D0E013|nr:hypothetical protein [Methanosphaera sp.]MCI5867878.1 hypothetical protein [Methanosphaera sp.]MDD6534888.1 hypothetical protein [Methanosphaera sp.]MDY3955348.1 hypothetical protein [Methanosphaera sp.]
MRINSKTIAALASVLSLILTIIMFGYSVEFNGYTYFGYLYAVKYCLLALFAAIMGVIGIWLSKDNVFKAISMYLISAFTLFDGSYYGIGAIIVFIVAAVFAYKENQNITTNNVTTANTTTNNMDEKESSSFENYDKLQKQELDNKSLWFIPVFCLIMVIIMMVVPMTTYDVNYSTYSSYDNSNYYDNSSYSNTSNYSYANNTTENSTLSNSTIQMSDISVVHKSYTMYDFKCDLVPLADYSYLTIGVMLYDSSGALISTNGYIWAMDNPEANQTIRVSGNVFTSDSDYTPTRAEVYVYTSALDKKDPSNAIYHETVNL